MLIIGERINTSRKAIAPAVASKDVAFVQNEAKRQAAAGAHYVDVNCGTLLEREPEYMAWLVDVVQEVVDVPLSIDSPNPAAVRVGLERHKNGQPFINSISNEKERFDNLLPLVLEYKAKVVAMASGSQEAMPSTAEERITEATRLVERLTHAGVPLDDIYVDPMVFPIGADPRSGKAVMETIRVVMERFPGVHTICGLSNVSYGLPLRKLLNQNFLVLCMAAGLDAAILDPTDGRLMSNILAAEALLGRDEFCVNYVQASREERLVL